MVCLLGVIGGVGSDMGEPPGLLGAGGGGGLSEWLARLDADDSASFS